MADATSGYWLYTTYSLDTPPEKLEAGYRLPGKVADYWAAIKRANIEIDCRQSSGPGYHTPLKIVRAPALEVLEDTIRTAPKLALFDVAPYRDSFTFEALKNHVKMNCGISLSLWESRALRPGEGPPRPLPRPTLPQTGGLQKRATSKLALTPVETVGAPPRDLAMPTTRLRGQGRWIIRASAGQPVKLRLTCHKLGAYAEWASYAIVGPDSQAVRSGRLPFGKSLDVTLDTAAVGQYNLFIRGRWNPFSAAISAPHAVVHASKRLVPDNRSS